MGRNARDNGPKIVVLWLVTIFFIVASSFFIIIQNYLALFFLAGCLLSGAALAAGSIGTLLWILFLASFVLQGSLQYFLGMNQANWIVDGVLLVILLKQIAATFATTNSEEVGFSSLPVASIFLGCYVLTFISSIIVNQSPPLQTISAVKNAIPVFLLCVVIQGRSVSWVNIASLWKLLVFIAVAQLFPVVYQHFYIAASRLEVGWDAVVGTLGGTPQGGGNSPGLELLVLSAFLYMLARRQNGVRSPWWEIGTLTCGLAVTLLGEVKAAIVWIPLGFVLVRGSRLFASFSTFIVSLISAGLVVAAIIGAYQYQYWDKQQAAGSSASIGTYFFDPNNVNYRSGEVGRIASLAIWALDEPAKQRRILGFGPGASKTVSALSQGAVALRYRPLQIDSTAIAVYLWDTGIVGAFFYIATMLAAFVGGLRQLKLRVFDPAQRACVETAIAVVGILLTFLIYNRTLTDEPATQVLYMFALGQILRAYRLPKLEFDAAAQVTPVDTRKPG